MFVAISPHTHTHTTQTKIYPPKLQNVSFPPPSSLPLISLFGNVYLLSGENTRPMDKFEELHISID